MVESSRDRIGFAAVLILALLAPLASRAADMPATPFFDPVEEERVTFGTGWYLRGDAAIASDRRLTVGNVSLPSSTDFINSWSIGIGAGYKYNDWLRTDVTLDWRAPRRFAGNTNPGQRCQFAAAPITNALGAVVGSTPVYGTCYDYTKANLTSLHVLFNGYVDIGTWFGVTPYVGAGVGFNYVQQKLQQNWFYNNQNPYNPTWTDPFSGATISAYWDQSRTTNSLQFAWAAMAGFSYAFTRNISADLGYRFLGLGNTTIYTGLGGAQTKYMRAQEIRLGVRYTAD